MLTLMISSVGVAGWPGDAGDSQTLLLLVSALDAECARRCGAWAPADNTELATIWTRLAFR